MHTFAAPPHARRLLLCLITSALVGCASAKEDSAALKEAPSAAEGGEAVPAAASERRGLGPSGPAVLIGAAAQGRAEARPDAPPDETNALLVAIDTPYEIFESQGSYIHVAAWRTDGQPAANAKVYVGDSLMGKTDANGAFVFIYPPPGQPDKKILDSSAITVVDAQDPRRQGSVAFAPNLRTESFASDQLYAYTDRGVYRPGERVHVRLIGWHLEEDYKPLPDAPLEVLLRDPAGAVVAGGAATTDADGIAAIDLAVPSRAAEGVYTLEVAYKEAREQARLQVRAFKPPLLRITHSLGRFVTHAQAALSFEVNAASLAGQAIARADLDIKLEAGGVAQGYKIKDAALPHTFKLTKEQLAALKEAAGEADDGGATDTWINVTIGVTDKRGRREELVRELRYVVNPTVAVLEADKSQYGTGEIAQIVARVRDLDGAPVRDVALTLKGEAAGQVWRATSDVQGTALFKVSMPAGPLPISLHMEGVEAPIATQELGWEEARPMTSAVEAPVLRERQRAKIRVTFPEGVRPAERVVHLDVVDTSGSIVQSALLTVEETPQGPVAQGSFEAPSWGTMLITLFALGKQVGAVTPDSKLAHQQLGLLTEGQSLVVHPDRTLEIVLDGVPDAARPGDKLSFKPRVRTPQGKEIDAAVGVALVDARIMSLRDPLEVTPMDQLYAPTLRTMSTTGAQILSWPVVSRNWGEAREDIALPPFPFLPGGAIVQHDDGTRGYGSMESPADGEEEDAQEAQGASAHGYGSGSSSGMSAVKKKAISNKQSIDAEMIEGKISKPESSIVMADKPVEDQKPSARPDGRAQGAPPQITIRTRFTDTSAWLPNARAGLGAPAIQATLPDAIAPQELVVVASDRDGGVGVARRTIMVQQPLSAEADLPAVLRVGESIELPIVVSNDSDVAREVTVSFEAAEADAALSTQTLKLAPRAQEIITARVKPMRAGAIAYKLAAVGGGEQDISRGVMTVIAGGLSAQTTHSAQASAAAPGAIAFTVPKQGGAATLSVSLPSTAFAAMDMRELGAQLADDPLSLASDLSSAALLLQYAQRHGIQSVALQELRQRVLGAIGQLGFAQADDGSFAYWRNGRPGAFMTAWALEGMLEAQALDITVPQEGITRAAEWLAGRIGPDGGFEVKEIAFWEGDGAAVREGVAAEVFHVLTLIPASQRTAPVEQAIERLATQHTAALAAGKLSPLATGRAILGLSRLKRLDQVAGKRALRALLAKRRDAHWEPSWFHAWGGMVELNTALILAMQACDAEGFAVELRDTLGWVLSTRDTWGRWHHERDTAAGMRALLALGAAPADAAGELTVLVDGKPVERVVIDAADPFLSALKLARLELPPLAPGQHTVEVRSTSKLTATATLRLDAPLPVSDKAATSRAASISVKAPASGAVGERAVMKLRAERYDKSRLPATISVATSGLVEVDLTELARALDANPAVARHRLTAEALHIELTPEAAALELDVPFTFTRVGQGAWPAASISGPGGAAIAASAGPLRCEL